jgi:DNA-directed RNA polymerase subunit beta'
VVDSSFIESNHVGTVKILNRNVVKDSEGQLVVMGRNVQVQVVDENGRERAIHKLTYGSRLKVEEGQKIERGQRIAEWDPYTMPILTEVNGTVEFEDVVEGVSIREVADEATGISSRVVVDWRASPRGSELRPAMVLKDKNGKILKLSSGNDARYLLSVDAILSVENGSEVHAGDVLARIPTEGAKTRDITGGLPRVAELFEARRPKDHAIIAEATGKVEFGRDYKNNAASSCTRSMRASSRSSTSSRRASTSRCRKATSSRRANSFSTATPRRTTSSRFRASRNWRPISSTRSRTSTDCRACRSTTSTSK